VNSPTGPGPVILDGCDADLAAAAGLTGCFIGTGGELAPGTASGGSTYIEPSGTVTTAGPHGPLAVAGATVTLEQSSAGGPFQPVPSGSAVMSPANRVNPGTTGPSRVEPGGNAEYAFTVANTGTAATTTPIIVTANVTPPDATPADNVASIASTVRRDR
jgi:hypothetical protein